MAYVAKEIEGKFYVGKGKSYYPSTEAPVIYNRDFQRPDQVNKGRLSGI